jgi:hypothetical protein
MITSAYTNNKERRMQGLTRPNAFDASLPESLNILIAAIPDLLLIVSASEVSLTCDAQRNEIMPGGILPFTLALLRHTLRAD